VTRETQLICGRSTSLSTEGGSSCEKISNSFSTSLHDNPLLTWKRRRGVAKMQNVQKRKSINFSCGFSEILQMLETRQNSIYFFFAFSLHLCSQQHQPTFKGFHLTDGVRVATAPPKPLTLPVRRCGSSITSCYKYSFLPLFKSKKTNFMWSQRHTDKKIRRKHPL